MPRPHRPNPTGNRKAHIRQETSQERCNRLREEAQERQAAWAALTPAQQLVVLNQRPGESKRQRARILRRMEQGVE